MKYLLLPGSSVKNRSWANELKDEFSQAGLKLQVIEWEHWMAQDKSFQFNTELAKLARSIDAETVIIAKSLGTFLFAKYIAKNKQLTAKIKFAVLCGIPNLDPVYDYLFTIMKAGNLLLLQNENDPYLAFKDLENYIKNINSEIKLIKGDRSDHHYPYADIILSELKKRNLATS